MSDRRRANQIAYAVRRVGALSLPEWRYLAIAVKELFLARIRLTAQPVGAVLRALQDNAHAPSYGGGELSDIDVKRLSWAINAAASRMPWRCDCLPRASAADRWLRRHQLQPQFFLGVTKGPTGRLEAHAWLRCRDQFVTGGDGRDFTPLLKPGSGEVGRWS